MMDPSNMSGDMQDLKLIRTRCTALDNGSVQAPSCYGLEDEFLN